MTQVYKLNYGCSKKRLNDLIHKGLEYEKEHGIDEKEVLKVRKDQQIEELKELLEHERQNYAQLESDYKKVNELGLEPSYIKRVIKENEQLQAELKKYKRALELVGKLYMSDMGMGKSIEDDPEYYEINLLDIMQTALKQAQKEVENE